MKAMDRLVGCVFTVRVSTGTGLRTDLGLSLWSGQ